MHRLIKHFLGSNFLKKEKKNLFQLNQNLTWVFYLVREYLI